MPGEVNEVAAPFWQQVAVFAGVAGAALVTAIQAYKKGRTETEASHGHVVLEAAEIADISVFKQLLQRYDAMLMVSAKVDDIANGQKEIYSILARMDRQEEIRGILREQQRRDDDRKS